MESSNLTLGKANVPLERAREALVSNLGALIRQERQKRGLTLVQTCERARVSPAFLSLIERGKARPSLGSLAGIADALGLPVSIAWRNMYHDCVNLLTRKDCGETLIPQHGATD